MTVYENYILNNIENFELIATSSNKTYRFTYEDNRYILKVNNISIDNLSPFWFGLQSVFGSNFNTQREYIEETLSLLDNPHIKIARFVAKSHKSKFQIFREADGFSYEPDDFPDNANIEYQLGQFIGFIHTTTYDYFGHQKTHFYSGFKQNMLKAMSELIQRYWLDSHAVKLFYEKISNYDISPKSYSLIMADLSANQFLFNSNLSSIESVVDFDAYVIGPREWELSVIEMCLKNGENFKMGYEQYNSFPDITGERDFYRFFMYLCDPWENQDLEAFLNRNIIF